MDTNIHLELPESMLTESKETQELVIEYLKNLTPLQKKAYLIAKEHLGTSFDILKSNGYNKK